MTTVSGAVTLARGYRRALNPVAFVARAFIRRIGFHLKSAGTVPSTCLDIGAGSAPYAEVLRQYADIGVYIAADVAASDRTSVVADGMRLPFPGEVFDLVVSFDVIQHIDHPGTVIDEAHRVLRNGGHLLLTYPFLYPECDAHDFRRWTLEGMRTMLGHHGFDIRVEQRRGGACFAASCFLTWTIQHLVPGQRRGWRANRSWRGLLRGVLLAGLTLPTQLLGWIALLVDTLVPSRGIYMGGCVLACKRSTAASVQQST